MTSSSSLYQVGRVKLEGPLAQLPGASVAYAPRRRLLDTVLAEAAVKSGVEFREQCTVTDVVFDGDRAVGVQCANGSARWIERAALTVGADGMRSRVAQAVKAPTILAHPTLTCVYYGFWPGVTDLFESYGARGRWIGCVPTHDGLTLIGVYFPQAEFKEIKTHALDSHRDSLAAVAPELYERVRASTQAERLFGTGTQPNFFRRAAGPGWALVGDAGYHKDSICADGITDAFRQAHLLTACIGADLHDQPRLAAALDRFGRLRNQLFLERYHSTLSIARLRADRTENSLATMAGDPGRVAQFFAYAAGVEPDVLAGLRESEAKA
jgi:2-polyprenyl-6-methoxyphenol hydroxylase-like FAD-dependent oxidoreductase